MVYDSIPGRQEIKSRRVQNAVWFVFISLFFVAMGVIFILYVRDVIAIALGILSVSYFGYVAFSAIINAFRSSSTMALSDQGLELYSDFGPVLIRWKNIEDIGSCGGYARMIGIKIKNYDEYLAYIPPEKVDAIMGKVKIRKVFYFMMCLITPRSSLSLWQEERQAYKTYQDVHSIRDTLSWSRENYGYDITLSWTALDRSPDLFLRLLEQYIRKFGDAFEPDDESLES